MRPSKMVLLLFEKEPVFSFSCLVLNKGTIVFIIFGKGRDGAVGCMSYS